MPPVTSLYSDQNPWGSIFRGGGSIWSHVGTGNGGTNILTRTTIAYIYLPKSSRVAAVPSVTYSQHLSFLVDFTNPSSSPSLSFPLTRPLCNASLRFLLPCVWQHSELEIIRAFWRISLFPQGQDWGRSAWYWLWTAWGKGEPTVCPFDPALLNLSGITNRLAIAALSCVLLQCKGSKFYTY